MISVRAKWVAVLVVVVLAAGAGATFAVRGGAWTKWRAQRYASRAEALARKGAKDSARTACLKALALDRDSLPATRTLLGLVPEGDLQSALLLRARIADLAPDDRENLRALAYTAILAQRFDLAETATRDLERTAGKTVEVLELRARIPAARGDFPAALLAARELLAQAQGNPAGRLIQALARMFTGDASEAIDAELTALCEIPAVRVEALRGLREAALRRGDAALALERAEQVVREPLASFADWLARAAAATKADPAKLDELLAELTTRAGADPQALGRIGAWLRAAGPPGRVEQWVAGTEALRKDPVTAQMILAETFAARAEWNRLDALLAEADWKQLDFLRLALRARAARGRQDEPAASKAWRAAVQAALADSSSARMLADTVQTWPEWSEDYEGLLWRAAQAGSQAQAWALTDLLRRATERRDTRQLRRVSEEMGKAFPDHVPVRNNIAFYSLLLGESLQRAHQLADELYAAHPTNPVIASTYALSLLKRDRAPEALAVLEKLPASARQEGSIALCHALALARAGQVEAARGIAATIRPETLLPEERELLATISSITRGH